ncbi:TPA: hypothetical protein ACF0SI_002783 [Enterococcus hirae]
MLKAFVLTKVGFNRSVEINDVFDDKEGNSWIIRAISNHRIEGRWLSGMIEGVQYDVILVDVVAQRVGTFSLANFSVKQETIVSQEKEYYLHGTKGYRSGDFVFIEEDGRFYVIGGIEKISYSFVTLVIEYEARSVTELPVREVARLKNKQKINDLGWQVK